MSDLGCNALATEINIAPRERAIVVRNQKKKNNFFKSDANTHFMLRRINSIKSHKKRVAQRTIMLRPSTQTAIKRIKEISFDHLADSKTDPKECALDAVKNDDR